MKSYRLLIPLVTLLAACATMPSTTAIPTPQPVASSTSMLVTPVPSNTPQPAALPATATKDIYAAMHNREATVAVLVAPCLAGYEGNYSPKRIWAYMTCQEYEYKDGKIVRYNFVAKLTRLDGSQQWSISYNDIYAPYAKDVNKIGQTVFYQNSFRPVRWTRDEDFVFFNVIAPTSVGTPKGWYGLFRLDLSNGKISPILRPSVFPLISSYTTEFSPDGTKLAYFNQSLHPIKIVIEDINSGHESSITLDARFSQGSSLLWSPYQNKLAVSVFDGGQNGGNAVIVYDLATMKNEYLLQQSASSYTLFQWLDASTIYAIGDPGGWGAS